MRAGCHFLAAACLALWVSLGHAVLADQADGPYPALHFQHLGAEALPAERSIGGLLQDAKGYLWVSTYFGFHRWDGARMRSYPGCAQVVGAAGAVTASLQQGADGSLWAVSSAQLLRIDPAGGRTQCWKIARPDAPARAQEGSLEMSLDGQGRPVLATNLGLLRFDPVRQVFQVLFGRDTAADIYALALRAEPGGHWYAFEKEWWWVPDQGAPRRVKRFDQLKPYLGAPWRDSLGDLCMNRDGELGCTTASGTWETYRDERGLPLAQCSVRSQDAQGRMWALCGGTLWRQSRADRRVMTAVPLGTVHDDTRTASLHLDRQGVFWLTMRGGVWLIHADTLARRFVAVARQRPDAPLAHEGGIVHIVEDRSGGIWLSAPGVGLSRAQTSPAPLSRLRLPDQAQGTPVSQMVRALHEDASSGGRVLYMATYDPEPWRLELDARGEVARALKLPLAPGPTPPYANEYRALRRDARGVLWYGSLGGLWRWHAVKGQFVHVSLAPAGEKQPVVQQLVEPADGSLWVVADLGLLRLPESVRSGGVAALPERLAWQRPTPATRWPSPVAPPYLDRQGAWWLPHWQGLTRFAPDEVPPWHSWQAADGLGLDTVHGVVERRPGELWLATRGAGVTRLTGAPQTPTFKTFGTGQGLPDPVIYGLQADDSGALWLSHNRGLTRWDPERGSMRHFGLGDGLPALEFNHGQAHRGASGHLYFGGTHGAIRISPAAFEQPRPQPHLDLDGVQVDEQRHAWRSVPAQLPHGTRLLEFLWSSVDQQFATDLRVRYRLVGADTAWQAGPGAGQARYVGLAPGPYRFELGLSNDGEHWVEAAPLSFEILPPWWRRPLTLTLGGLALMGLGLAYAWRQRRHRRRLQRALQAQRVQLDAQNAELLQLRAREAADAAAQAERSALTRDVHDGLGFNLRRAMMAVRRDAQAQPRALLLLEDCMAELHLVVDTRHSGDEPLSVYLAQLRYRAGELCEHAGLEWRWQMDALQASQSLGLNARLNLGRFLMEAISNVIRHAQARSVRVKVEEVARPAALILTVEDDGCGFNVADEAAGAAEAAGGPPSATGQGLRNMRARAQALEATLTLDSSPGHGTRWRLCVPLGGPGQAPDEGETT